jgi:phosphatidate cytidylyltransferase
MILVTAVVGLAAVEVFAGFRRAGYHPATLLGIVATISVLIATYNKGLAAPPLVLVLLFAFTILWHLAAVDPGADPVFSTASTVFAFCWIGVFGSFGALLLDPRMFPSRHGIAFLVGTIVVVVFCDIGALAAGRLLGKHPMAPTASPTKTWEGFVGGAIAAVFAGLIIVRMIHPWTLGSAVTLGLVVSVVCPIGDLSESLVKRHLGVKDMSRIMPGHGGILDRVDGLLFMLPATFYLVKAFHLG